MYEAFIVNPVAGTGFALKTMAGIEKVLKERHHPYRVFRTEYPGHATQLAQNLANDQDVRAVVSVGGDGTAFETAAGLAGSRKPMGIIPAGPGNDFIKTAGIPKDPMAALELIMRGTASPVDIGRMNNGYFLNVCGTGFDVTVLDNAQSLKSRFRGLLPYFLGLLKAIFQYKPVHLKLIIDGKEEEGNYLICSVANGQYIGGGIPICPAADIRDGRLNLVLVESVPRWKIPFYLPGLLLGKILSFRVTRHCLAEEIFMEGDNLRVNVDGEIFPMNQSRFSVRKSILNLICEKA